jgi:hypothetical protein
MREEAQKVDVPFCHILEVEATPKIKRLLQDTGGCFPVVKALIDGLVDAGALIDDGPKYVTKLTFNSPERMDTEEGVLVRIRGEICDLV